MDLLHSSSRLPSWLFAVWIGLLVTRSAVQAAPLPALSTGGNGVVAAMVPACFIFWPWVSKVRFRGELSFLWL